VSTTVTQSPAASKGFSAADLRRRMAEREAAKAAEGMRRIQEREAKLKAIIDEFHQPPARTAEQLMELITQLVSRAAENGESEVQVYEFPSSVCADRGRAINNFEADWYKGLTGRPRLAYEFWQERLRPLGFGLRAQILDYPDGFPGEVGLFLTW
jgi:hypothetical protein